MPNTFTLTLDTTAPANPSLSIEGGANYLTDTSLLGMLTIGTTDADTTGYQMLIWGDVDPAFNPKIQAAQPTDPLNPAAGQSGLISYATSQQVKVSPGDGPKSISVIIYDDLMNPSAVVSDSIILDTTLPTVTVSLPDVGGVSDIPPKNVASFNFSADSNFDQWTVRVVSSTGATHDTGIEIGSANGSTNMNGAIVKNAGDLVNCTINGADLKAASPGDGNKIIKVFVREANTGQWSS